VPVSVSERERAQLGSLVRRRSCPRQVAVREQIVLAAAAGEEVRESDRRLGVARLPCSTGDGAGHKAADAPPSG
jgi:hypothetical protein